MLLSIYVFLLFLYLPFHFEQELSQPQVTSFCPLTAAIIIAEAHPAPLFTCIAFVGQLSWQAPHSMHASGFTNRAVFLSGLNTLWGHIVLHIPQLLLKSGSNFRVFEPYELNISNSSQYSH
jgi:hypothetical protein